VEILSSPQGSLIQIEKRRLKADQQDLKWWMRGTLQRGEKVVVRRGGMGHCDGLKKKIIPSKSENIVLAGWNMQGLKNKLAPQNLKSI
jgi:hypothetical protein